MDSRSDSSKAVLLLLSGLAPNGPLPLKVREYRKLCGLCGDPSTLIGKSQGDLTKLGLVPELAERVTGLLDQAVSLALVVESYAEKGIKVVTEFDAPYPKHLKTNLGPKAPSLLFVAGSLDLLSQPGVGVVGSRNVDEQRASTAREAGAYIASLGVPIVSGNSRGVDLLSMNGTYEEGGSAIAVLSDSLESTIKEKEVRNRLLNEEAVFCSPYRPDSNFTIGTAMGRNKIIYGLSVVTLVVHSAFEKGGTWAGAKEAIRGKQKVAIWDDADLPGNQGLIELGGIPIKNINLLKKIQTQAQTINEPTIQQQALFPNS